MGGQKRRPKRVKNYCAIVLMCAGIPKFNAYRIGNMYQRDLNLNRYGRPKAKTKKVPTPTDTPESLAGIPIRKFTGFPVCTVSPKIATIIIKVKK